MMHVVLSVLAWIAAATTSADVHDHPDPVVLAPGYSALEFTPPAPGNYALPPLGQAADGPVIDINGQPHNLQDYLGDKITVMSFIYTTCNDINGCPLAAFVFKSVQDAIAADARLQQQVRLLSFSFDPDHDTPSTLKAYASHFVAPDSDWQFLTTQSQAALDPTLEAYGQWVIRDYDSEGNYLGTMSHVLRVFLIDKQHRIRNIYSTSFLHADTVVNDIRTLILESER
jgi:cytochrome oxidase Cu insertion factor (SCO1/SenC/PrrC family)